MVDSLRELLYISGLQYLKNAEEISLGYKTTNKKKHNIVFDNSTNRINIKINGEKLLAFGSTDYPSRVSGNKIYFFNIPKTIEAYLSCDFSTSSKPSVNIIADFFRETVVNFLSSKNIFIPIIYPLPDNLPVLFVSHDIDLLRYSKFYDIFRPNKFKKISDFLALFNPRYDRYWNIDRIIQWEKENSIKSTYFFITRSKDKHARRYSLTEAKPTIELLKKNNIEIGLHLPDFEKIDSESVSREIKIITKYASVKGVRKHYLTDDFLGYINALNGSGINYDSTAGFRNQIGFKIGTSYPIWYGDVLEIPLLIMDSALMKSKGTPEELMELLDKYGGIFSVLFHNHILAPEYKNWWLQIKNLIDEFRSKSPISMSGLDLLNWRKQIDSLEINLKKNKLIIKTEKHLSNYPVTIEYNGQKYRFFTGEVNHEKNIH